MPIPMGGGSPEDDAAKPASVSIHVAEISEIDVTTTMGRGDPEDPASKPASNSMDAGGTSAMDVATNMTPAHPEDHASKPTSSPMGADGISEVLVRLLSPSVNAEDLAYDWKMMMARTIAVLSWPMLLFAISSMVPFMSPQDGPGIAYFVKTFLAIFGTTCIPTMWVQNLSIPSHNMNLMRTRTHIAGQVLGSLLGAGILQVIGAFGTFPIPYAFFVILFLSIVCYEPFIMKPMIFFYNPEVAKDKVRKKAFEKIMTGPPAAIATSCQVIVAYILVTQVFKKGTLVKTILILGVPAVPPLLSKFADKVLKKVTGDSHFICSTANFRMIYAYMIAFLQTEPDVFAMVFTFLAGLSSSTAQLVLAQPAVWQRVLGAAQKCKKSLKVPSEDDLTRRQAEQTLRWLIARIVDCITPPLRIVQVSILYKASPNLQYLAGIGVHAYGQHQKYDDDIFGTSMAYMTLQWAANLFTLLFGMLLLKTFKANLPFLCIWSKIMEKYAPVLAGIAGVCLGTCPIQYVLLHDGLDLTGGIMSNLSGK
eukprot:TRINITY_DN29342_c0_g1_i1.p1 TRINITY_DN29342_c0_g1~~TRINITY_DN29342_c0_g1_i1.p1  ORF type:complete len:535 (+),score=96.69 TRINITY_DN29342_c0_g1_i1:95-1699(+)